ncbi:MAG: 30S ribosomal protein S6 [Candidatus Magasanikbacteria bacterium]|nr:30S ribosomal protein S6 [Candidatus Magasanikbacteria bacterium]
MNHYELFYLVSGTYTEDELIPLKEKVNAILTKNGATISHEENLGKKKLAYPVKKVRYGYYLLVDFDIEPEMLKKTNNDLHLTSDVLRHTIVKRLEPTQGMSEIKQKLEAAKTEVKKEHVVKEAPPKPGREKLSLDDLDKKLDEILEGDIL